MTYLILNLPLTIGQHLFSNRRHIIGRKNTSVPQLALSFRGLFSENVAKVLFFVFNLASPGKAKTLAGTFLCFHFGHDTTPVYFWAQFQQNT
jgi:hypothetical protein